MQRRSVVAALAAGLAGLSLDRIPDLEPAAPLSENGFVVAEGNLAESSGTVTCPVCHEMGDALGLTPAGLCLRCADAHPTVKAHPRSNPFWILSPSKVRRLEGEIQRLATELNRMNLRFLQLRQQRFTEGSDRYDRAIESNREKWHALQRELHLLHLLRAASRQFA